MYAVEVVQVRLFDVNDGDKVIDAFNRITQAPQPFQVTLYQSAKVGNDWSICYWKPSPYGLEVKSPEAAGLAESLRTIGFVDHSLWLPVPMNQGEQLSLKNIAPHGENPVIGKGRS
jgi:hypothetical protein